MENKIQHLAALGGRAGDNLHTHRVAVLPHFDMVVHDEILWSWA
jgi:hypothetical protein